MKNIFHWRFFSISAQIFLILIIFFLASCRQSPDVLPSIPENSVLIINSDKSVDKYATIQQEFESEFDMNKVNIDFAGQTLNTHAFQKRVANARPYLVYAIGSKAYTLASQVIQDTPLIFSSMINWRRFTINPNTYGISLELPAEMQLFLFSYLFPDIQNLGVLYSQRHNSQWFDLAVKQAEDVGLSLQRKIIEDSSEVSQAIKALLPKVDALWLISDPIVLYDENAIQTIFTETTTSQKPIFAYNTLFIRYGAVLTVSADIPTMGRQAAGLAHDLMKQQTIDEKVQFPAGSQVTLNLKKVHEYGIKINHAALSSVENIIQ